MKLQVQNETITKHEVGFNGLLPIDENNLNVDINGHPRSEVGSAPRDQEDVVDD